MPWTVLIWQTLSPMWSGRWVVTLFMCSVQGLILESNSLTKSNPFSNQVLGMPAKKNVILYGCCSDPYPDITFTLHLKRRASFYIFNLLIPCMMISFLAPLGFYLPADSGEKVSLGVTVLLALTVFQLLVAESMPPSESVPLIGKRTEESLVFKFCLNCSFVEKILR